jgi:hypothetical protein
MSMTTPYEEYLNRWKEYRRLKMTLVALICGWIPFGLLVGAAEQLTSTTATATA